MERDPLRLAWTTRPALHVLAALSLAVAGVFVLLAVDLVRIIVDHVVLGAPPVPLFRVAIDPPPSLGLPALVLFPGFTLEPVAFRIAAVASLLVLPLAAAVFVGLAEATAARIGGAVLARVRGAILDGVLAVAPGARDGAQEAVAFAGDTLARESNVLGSAVLAPLQAGAAVALALLYVLSVDWRLAAVAGALLLLAAALSGRRLGGRLEAMRARRDEGLAVDQAFADLLRRVPALRAHGTAAFERQRISVGFAAAHRPVEALERRLTARDGLAAASLAVVPLAVLGLAAWIAGADALSPGKSPPRPWRR